MGAALKCHRGADRSQSKYIYLINSCTHQFGYPDIMRSPKAVIHSYDDTVLISFGMYHTEIWK